VPLKYVSLYRNRLKKYDLLQNILAYCQTFVPLQCVKWNTNKIDTLKHQTTKATKEHRNGRRQRPKHECLFIYCYGYSRKVRKAWHNVHRRPLMVTVKTATGNDLIMIRPFVGTEHVKTCINKSGCKVFPASAKWTRGRNPKAKGKKEI
jgi:hypothetical protein